MSRAMIFAGAIAVAPAACASQVQYQPIATSSSAATNTGQVKGRMLRNDSKPAGMYPVTLYGENLRARTGGGDAMTVHTSANGYFEFVDLPPGEYRIGANRLENAPTFAVRAGQAAMLTLELEPPPKVDRRHMAKPYGAPPARRRLV